MDLYSWLETPWKIHQHGMAIWGKEIHHFTVYFMIFSSYFWANIFFTKSHSILMCCAEHAFLFGSVRSWFIMDRSKLHHSPHLAIPSGSKQFPMEIHSTGNPHFTYRIPLLINPMPIYASIPPSNSTTTSIRRAFPRRAALCLTGHLRLATLDPLKLFIEPLKQSVLRRLEKWTKHFRFLKS